MVNFSWFQNDVLLCLNSGYNIIWMILHTLVCLHCDFVYNLTGFCSKDMHLVLTTLLSKLQLQNTAVVSTDYFSLFIHTTVEEELLCIRHLIALTEGNIFMWQKEDIRIRKLKDIFILA